MGKNVRSYHGASLDVRINYIIAVANVQPDMYKQHRGNKQSAGPNKNK